MRVQRIVSVPLAITCAFAACTKSNTPATDTSGYTAGGEVGGTNPSNAPLTTNTPSAGATSIAVAQNDTLGSYLTDGNGRALYLFEKDSKDNSACNDACATSWPPLIANGVPAPQGTGLQTSQLTTFTRADGRKQVSYNGHPLYYYHKDQGAGSTMGQGVEEFGAEWYLVAPSGSKVEKGEKGEKNEKGAKSTKGEKGEKY